MALFQPRRQAPPPRSIHPRPNPAARRAPQALLPEFMHRIHPRCHDHRHPLPVTMLHTGDALSDRGQPMANYRCPLCHAREGWVIDVRTARPFRLFRHAGPH